MADIDEEKRLKAVALQNAATILQARQRAEHELAAERERLRITLASIGDAVISTDAEGRVTFLNGVAEELTGWTHAEAAGQPLASVFTIVNEHSRKPVENPALRALTDGVTVGLANHTVLIAKDGTERPIDDSAAPIQDAAGAVVGAVLVFRDVTERKRAEVAMARLAAIVHSSDDAIVSKTLDGVITSWNRGAERIFGYTADEAVGQPITLIISPDRLDEEREILSRLRRGERIDHFETVRVAKDGRRLDISLTVSPIRDSEGNVVGASKVARDVTDRKRAEEDRARLAAIVSSSDDAIVSKTLDGVIRSWNQGAERIFGYTADEAVGQPITLLIPPELVDEERAILSRLRRGERIDHFETVRVAKDGRRLDILLSVSPIRDAGGQIIGASKVARDITDRKRAERLLKESESTLREREERLNLFVENATDYAVILSDPTDLITEWLGGAERITGWPAEEVLGKPVSLIFTPEDRAAGVPEQETARAAATGRAENVRWHQKRDGTRFFAEGVTVGLRGPGGELRGFGKVFRDATPQKQAQSELLKRNERLRLLWEAASVLLTTEEPDAMLRELFSKLATHLSLDAYFNYMVTDRGDSLRLESCHGVPEDVARSLERLDFGQAVCGTVARTREAMVVEKVQESADERVSLIKSLGVRAYACNPLLADGRMLGTLSFASRRRDRFDSDELEFLTTVTHYVTVAYERLRLVRELRDTDRKKDDFIALLAHELRNPLAPIRNGLQVLRLAEDRRVRERSQDMMDRQLTHMVRLVDDLLDVARVSRNKMELRKGRVRLADAVSSAVETARPLIDAAEHRLDVSLPPEPVLLDADLTRLAQVFANLLTNSAKYTEQGGRITLSAEVREGAVVVSVRDTGIGIPAANLPTIFDMFSQVDRSIERSTGGLGIGLALVKGLVEMHGGTVTAESEGLGRGSTFTVWLPTAEDTPQTEAFVVGASARRPTSGRRVLVVDDNRDSATSMAMMLQLLGDEVRVAYDGLEAVEAAETFRPEVILMDVGMPRLSGYDATRRIREKDWGRIITIVAVTGWGQEGDRAQSKAAGCDGHLVKPVSLPDLERLLSELGRGGQATP